MRCAISILIFFVKLSFLQIPPIVLEVLRKREVGMNAITFTCVLLMLFVKCLVDC